MIPLADVLRDLEVLQWDRWLKAICEADGVHYYVAKAMECPVIVWEQY